MTLPQPLSLLAEPSHLIFTNYTSGTIYKQKFSLRNVYSTACAVKIKLSKKSKYFRLEAVKKVGKIAPGLEVQYFVYFQPDSDKRQYTNGLTIDSEYGTLQVPILASNASDLDVLMELPQQTGGTMRTTRNTATNRSARLKSSTLAPQQTIQSSTINSKRHLLLQDNNIAQEIIWEESPVKSHTSKEIYIRNNGKELVEFDVTTEEPFFVEITHQQALLTKRNRTNGQDANRVSVDGGNTLGGSTTLTAHHTTALSAPHTQAVKLQPGEGVQLSIVFYPTTRYKVLTSSLRFHYKPTGDEEEIILKASSMDVNCKLSANSLRLPDTFIQKINQSSFSIVNNSDIRIKFSWRNLPSQEDEWKHVQDTLSLGGSDHFTSLDPRNFDESDLLFHNRAFSITPLEGEIWPHQEFTCTVDFHPSYEGFHQDMIAWCDVSGREMRLPIAFSGLANGPQTQFSFSSLDVGDVFINSKRSFEVYLENRGKIDADFNLLPSHSLFSSAFNFSPSQGTIHAGEVQLIKIQFLSDLIGEFSESFQWQISGSTEKRTLHFSGRVIGPSFAFNCSEIDFGTVSYNFVNTEYIDLSNTSEIPMKFKLRIPEDGSLMRREFDIVPHNGTILPHATKQIKVELLSNSLKEYKAHLVLDIEDVGQELASIPISAQCVVPEVMLSSGNINFGDCFITYPYHQHMELSNSTSQPAKYEIVLPPENKEKVELNVDHLKGVVPSNSSHKIKISLNCSTPGAHFFPLYIRILGSDRPPFEIPVQATAIGPIVTADVKKIDFGRISVLEDHQQHITLTNKSPIPASVTISNKNSLFRSLTSQLNLEPESSKEIVLVANIDEAMKFSDDLLIDIEKGGKFKLRMFAAGKGSSLVPSMDVSNLDFGNQFTKRPCQIKFTVENKGRKAQQIQWQIPYKKKKPGDDAPPELEIFKIIPDRAEINPKSAQEFTVEGFSEEIGEFSQMLTCKIARQKNNIFECSLHCIFTLPLIRFSEKKLSFDYIYSSKRPPTTQVQPLTVKNVSPIDLEFSVKTPPGPFSLQQMDYVLSAGESTTLSVVFDPSYRGDQQTHHVKQKLMIVYAKHPQKDFVDLHGSIYFPNIKLEMLEVDFGTVLNTNEKHKYVKMMNESKAVVNYNWTFDVLEGEHSHIRYNDYFDILPTQGSLQPGDVQNIQFIYRGSQDVSLLTHAICKVEGGPDYQVLLKAESGTISYSIDKNVVDFGKISFDCVEERELTLFNKGKVPFQFQFDMSTVSVPGRIDLNPPSGVVAAESAQTVVASLFPGAPESILEKVLLKVDNFNPEEIQFQALSVHPTIHLDLERKADELFSSAQREAEFKIQKGQTLDNAIAQIEAAAAEQEEQVGSHEDLAVENVHRRPEELHELHAEAERIQYAKHLAQNPLQKRRLPDEAANEMEQTTRSTMKRGKDKPSQIPEDPSVDADYALATYICDFGNIIKGMSKKEKFSVTNTGYLPVTISVDKKALAKAGFQVKPNVINQLPAYPNNQSQSFEILFQTKAKSVPVGPFTFNIPLRIHNGPVINVEARANIILPELQISSKILNFGRMYVSRTRFISVQLYNPQPTVCEYAIEHSKTSEDALNFVCQSPSGVLESGERSNVLVQFVPTSEKAFSATLLLKCNHNPRAQQIVCLGEGAELEIEITPSNVELAPVLPHISSEKTITIKNHSDIDVEIFSLDFDDKYKEEQDILTNLQGFEEGAVMIDPRKAGEPLPQWILDDHNQKDEASDVSEEVNAEEESQKRQSNDQELAAKQDQDVGVGMIKRNKNQRRMYVCVYGPPLSGKSQVARELSVRLGLPIVNIDTIVKDKISAQEGAESASASPQETLQQAIEEMSRDEDRFAFGFIIDDLTSSQMDVQAASTAIVSGVGTANTVHLVVLSIDELAIKIREQTLRAQELQQELEHVSLKHISEDDFQDMSPEERLQYQKSLRSTRQNTKTLETIQKQKGSLEHLRTTTNKDAENLVPLLLQEAQNQEAEAGKKGGKGKNEPPPTNQYEIQETDDEITRRLKVFKHNFVPVYKAFMYPHGEPQADKGKGKKKTDPADDLPQIVCAHHFAANGTPQVIVDKVLDDIKDLFPPEDDNALPDAECAQNVLVIPEPYTKQLVPIPRGTYKPRKPVDEFSLWELHEPTEEERVDDPKAKKGKKGKAVEEAPPQPKKVRASRWVVPAHGKVEVLVQFYSGVQGTFTNILNFGITGRELQYHISCTGTCSYPQMSALQKSIFPNTRKSRPANAHKKIPAKKFFLNSNTFEFGPLLMRDDYQNMEDERAVYRETLTFTNNGLFDTHVEFGVADTSDETNCFRFEPAALDLKPDESASIIMKAEPSTKGEIKNQVVCCIQNNPVPFVFDVAFIGATPQVDIDSPEVDFGKLLLTTKPTVRKLKITNASTIPVLWNFADVEKLNPEFTVTPTEGKLKYKESQEITVIFKTDKAVVVENALTLKVSDEDKLVDAPDQKITIKSEAYDLMIDMDTTVDLGTVKVVDTTQKGINMENKGKYDVKYKWVIDKALAKYFSITPQEGILESEASQASKKKEKKKAPPKKKGQPEEPEGTVQLTFNTGRAIAFKNSTGIKAVFLEPETEEQLGEASLNISLNALYSKFSLMPVHGLNFGPLNFGKEKTKELELTNTGAFDITFKMEPKLAASRPGTANASRPTSSLKKEASKGKKDAKAPAKGKGKGAKEPEGMRVGPFQLSPKDGTIAPGGKAVIKVNFQAEGQGLFREVVAVNVSDTKPAKSSVQFDLQGESCVPGINTNDFDSIFEEQQVVNSLSSLAAGESAFAVDEQVFSFGTVTSNQQVVESLRIANPFKVPSNVEIAVQPRDKNDAAAAKAFDVQPKKLFIPPHEHRYVKVYFSPQALQSYSAIFEANVVDGNDTNTNKLRFELRGDGSLPQISLKQPSTRDASNRPLLKFPRTLVGRKAELPVVIKNEGVLAASYRFDMSSPSDTLDFPQRGKEMILEPGQVEQFTMHFSPDKQENIQTELRLVVPDNHFEDTVIQVSAEAFAEDITFEDLPEGEMDIVKLGDCPVGVEKPCTFVLQNHSKSHMRFDWSANDYISIVPQYGHIHAKSQKEISISLKTSEPKELKDEKIKFVSKKIEFTNLRAGSSPTDWDDTHRTVRWIEVEDKPEPEPTENAKKGKSAKGKKDTPPPSTEPPKMITKRVEEVDPEPENQPIEGQEKTYNLAVQGRADYAKFSLHDIETNLRFADTHMFTERQVTFEMRNVGNVEFTYDWEFTEYEKSAFSISPSQGTLKANSAQKFVLSFAPLDVDAHSEVIVCNIPNLAPDAEEPRISMSGNSTCPIVHFELTPSDYLTNGRRDPELPGPDGSFGELDPKTKVLELKSCGIRIRNTKRFYILNPTNISYKYQWKRLSDPQASSMFECTNMKGIIHSGKKTEVSFEYVPNTLETRECFWMFSIPERNIHVPFLIVGSADEPRLYFDQPRINFRTVLVGAVSSSTIKLINREEIPFSFALEKSKFTSPNEPEGPRVISVSPASGTIGPRGEQTLEIKFKPSKEESYNFNLVCKIKKKPNPLTCNLKGEGFAVHEKLEFGDSHQSIVHVKSNELDFGQVQINDKQVKTVVLYNQGDYNYDFSWQKQSNRYISIVPEAGTVEKRGKVICSVIFNPTRPISIQTYKAVCKVTNGNAYTIAVNAEGIQPRINFAFKHFDFGPRFLHHQGSSPSETYLKITNEDQNDISFDVEFENKPYMEVEGASTLLKSGESSKIKCIFMPREYKKYRETITFHVNGLYKIPVILEGEGTPVRIDLAPESAKNISFGALRVGESSTKSITVQNKSKIPATIAFAREQDHLRKNFVSVDVREPLVLKPRQIADIPLTFNPKARLQSFTEELYAIVEGQEQKLTTVLGSCQGIEVKLNPYIVSFGMVVQNTQVTQKVILENNGDIGIKFQWNKKNFRPDFTIAPMHGYVAPNEEITLDVTFFPKKIKSIKYDNIECKIEGAPSQFLTITGTCVDKPEHKEALNFTCAVRQEDIKTVVVENDTKDTWMIRPSIDSECWRGDDFLEVPPTSKVNYTITYNPKRTSKRTVASGKQKKEVTHDEGTLFFPLPNGNALLYALRGETQDPLASGEVNKKVSAKLPSTLSVVVENWLPQAQRFHVDFDFENIRAPDYIKGVPYVDIPALAKKTYKFTFEAFKQGTFQGRIVFKNQTTGEFLFYICTFEVESAKVIETIQLETPVRQRIAKSITVENPLNEETTLTVSCQSPDVQIPQEVLLQPKTSSRVDISFLPLVATSGQPQEVDLTLQSVNLGVYPYKLVLNALPAGPEKNIHFSAALGNAQTQTLRFRNLSRVATEYTVSFENKDQQEFTLTDKPLIKVPAAVNEEGNEVSFDVLFEPTKLGKFKSKILISAKQGGDYSFVLFGHCTPPRPQGPIEIAPNGSAQVAFKNVFGDAKQKTDFRAYVDHSAFSIKPDSMSLGGKQKTNIAVSFKPDKAGELVHGKLTIEKKDDPKLCWVFYLRGLTQAPPKGGK
mmetsp:Transcript_3107/g.11897  ORF Transcript_3107/g.11897 Transcript_3107/m.11897 type:complete len:4490 (-) Transcript_3107:1724-15193(-)|eukprot:CAMPEP_0117435796 /NCGR_PEP_ID=MMETSP0759-20121206/669_1 /TAXON_ID=63605 /ORGANISM="Percolomonas cosmopolitus, Strain WS" /LENGTH=4489 /DNA_ID=CAMNT_0005227361 /DNA_START=223 /DNA_END=13692 /DNA_ORIENTATION=+